MIKKFNEYINEGLVDKMKPKTEEEIFNNIINNEYIVDIDDYNENISDDIREFLNKYNIDESKIKILDNEKSSGDDFVNFILSLIKYPNDSEEYESDKIEIIFTYYKKDEIIYATDEYEIEFVMFYPDKIKEKIKKKLNESLLDKMEPKSETEVKKELYKSIEELVNMTIKEDFTEDEKKAKDYWLSNIDEIKKEISRGADLESYFMYKAFDMLEYFGY